MGAFNKLRYAVLKSLFKLTEEERRRFNPELQKREALVEPDEPWPRRPSPPPGRLVPGPRGTPSTPILPPDGVSFGLGLGGGLLAHQLLQREEERRRETSSPSPSPAPIPVITDDTGTYSDPVIAPFGPSSAPEPVCTVVEADSYKPVEFSCPAPAPVYEPPAPAPYEPPAPSPSYDSGSSSSYDSGSSSSSSDW